MKILVVVLLSILSNSLLALDNNEFIKLLLNNHAFFEKENINLKIKKIEMDGDYENYAGWEWDISAELGRVNKDKNKENYTSSSDYAKSTNQDIRKISTDISKKFLSNGSELNLSFDKSLPVKDEEMHDKNGYQQDKNTTEYLDDIELSWTIPLLKNSGGVIDQKTYDLSVLYYKDEELYLAEIKEDFLEDKMMIFLDLLSYIKQADVINSRLIKSKYILNNLDKDSVSKSSLLVLQRSINKNNRKLLTLKSKLNAEKDLIDSLVPSVNINELFYLDYDFALVDNLNRYIVNHNRDIKRINIEKLQNLRYIKTYENSELPDLDFTITTTRDENKGNYSSYTKSVENEYEAKLEFSYPLTGDVTNKTYLSKYKLKSRQIDLKYKDKFDDILADTTKLTTLIQQGNKQMNLYKSQIISNYPFKDIHFDKAIGVRYMVSEMDDIEDLYIDQIVDTIELYKNQVKYDSLLDRLLPKENI